MTELSLADQKPSNCNYSAKINLLDMSNAKLLLPKVGTLLELQCKLSLLFLKWLCGVCDCTFVWSNGMVGIECSFTVSLFEPFDL